MLCYAKAQRIWIRFVTLLYISTQFSTLSFFFSCSSFFLFSFVCMFFFSIYFRCFFYSFVFVFLFHKFCLIYKYFLKEKAKEERGRVSQQHSISRKYFCYYCYCKWHCKCMCTGFSMHFFFFILPCRFSYTPSTAASHKEWECV